MKGVKIRRMRESDLMNSYLEVFDSERKANLTLGQAKKIYRKIALSPNHVIFVATLGSRIIGTTTIIIEQKFVRNGGKVGHIEDVEVRKEYANKSVGTKLMKTVLDYAKKEGCYKTILDCSKEVMPFYKSLGFIHQTFLGSNVMRYNHKP